MLKVLPKFHWQGCVPSESPQWHSGGIPLGLDCPHIFRHAAFFKKYEHSQKTCIYDYHDYATNTQHEVTHLT